MIAIAFIILLNKYVLSPGTKKFQDGFLPRLENKYEGFLSYALQGKRPLKFFLGDSRSFVFHHCSNECHPPKSRLLPCQST